MKLSASILSADFLYLADELDRVEKAGCDYIHLDITDGHFVPNITMGVCGVEAVCKHTKMRKDVHLMIDNPEKFIKPFADLGVDTLTFHAEATKHPFEIIKYIRETDCKLGVALDPATPVETIMHYIDKVDIVLMVSVCVGFPGQKYFDTCDSKLKKLDEIRKKRGLDFEIQIDGGITKENAKEKCELGADTLIAGSMFFNAKDTEALVKEIRG